MNPWDWLNTFAKTARDENDTQRIYLVRLFLQANALRDVQLDRKLQILQQGLELAETLNEPWFVVLFRREITKHYIYYRRDIPPAIDLAIENTVEVQKNIYSRFPMRVCTYEDLIAAYSELDPEGYAAEISDAIAYMAKAVDPSSTCVYCVQSRRIHFMLERVEYAEANSLALKYLNAAESSGNALTMANARGPLCFLASQSKDWATLLTLSQEAEALLSSSTVTHTRAVFLLWQALAQQQLGASVIANRLYRQALNRMARSEGDPSGDYYEALSGYLEAIGNANAALQVRDRHLKQVIRSNSPHYESKVRLIICELKARMGILTEDDLAQARQAAQKLRAPAKFLARLESLQPSSR